MFKLKKITVFIGLIILSSLLFSSCMKDEINPISKQGIFLGTVCKITSYDNVSLSVFDKAYNRVNEIENKMSINKSPTEITKINESSGKNYIKVSNDVMEVINKSIYYSSISENKFDISIGCIDKLWNIGTEKARIPSQKEITSKLPLVNYKNILINKKENLVMLKNKGMLIDLGAIAKGYAGDEVKRILKENGVNHAVINLGGNIVTIGNNPNGNKWLIGIKDPFIPSANPWAKINIYDKSIVTSGIYERFFEKNGKRYHHILDTKTGYPVNNSLVSVSIIADKSIDADALSTTTFSLGLNKGLKLIESLNGIEAIFVTKNHEVFLSSGLKNNFQIINSNFKLKNY
ncbi:thiamine biosynthesis protein ApbE [Clostridium novyi B str. ATCC 27606]|uniref:FAD:protein FMN transferase n=3 Tax=Clostridium TaxID=1485 RepID=A0AA40M4K0_CLONO|nr:MULTISPECIES: FAD:protein FMN transferase [Clostridium]KEI12703.1 thiamine biosynthesis protein ApbE [Clostridium novyi B str. ATCC 27606]KEI14736.1 thiamine biosynthesis protein ApbE [Clostridium novyi B str. NCTC 9691]KEI15921.1 thiamine biosynthesis protein ApbE [Clostridium haemolyticum NCTC 9693]KGN00272.1 thiamine biosynthesis protein ApbE [Clostridium haemolyticum NCTC 8350]CAG7839206.1 FAD:protein FMN transferase [Clostridium haemolyticum]